MKYVFFDIECANGGIGSICSFGYVITDENFNVIIQRDIVINPPGKFNLTGRDGRPDIILAYPEWVFRSSPKFYHYYDEIEGILTGENQIVVGHSAANDAVFLNKSCSRYKKPFLDFKFFDTQKLYSKLNNDKKQVSLERALEVYEVEKPSLLHRSDIDAFATMKLVKEICKRQDMSLIQLVETNISCTGESKNGEVLYYGETLEGKKQKKELKRREKEGSENVILKGRRNHILFLRMMDYAEPQGDFKKVLNGKKVCLSLNYEQTHFKEMIHIVQRIVNLGGKYVLKASESDVFATFECIENGEVRKCTRLEYVMESERKDEITIITMDELLDILGTSLKELESLEPLNIDYLLDEKYEKRLLV